MDVRIGLQLYSVRQSPARDPPHSDRPGLRSRADVTAAQGRDSHDGPEALGRRSRLRRAAVRAEEAWRLRRLRLRRSQGHHVHC